MPRLTSLNDNWLFAAGFDAATAGAPLAGETVRLPHNAVELPFSYFDERDYQRAFTYQRVIAWDENFAGEEIAVVFDGAMADAVVYLNGEPVAAHTDGYTPFEARLTGRLRPGDNLLTVKVDGSENPDIPPFGGMIDYLTYAGIYRDVWLKRSAPVALAALKVETADPLAALKTITVRAEIANPQGLALAGALHAVIRDAAGQVAAETRAALAADETTLTFADVAGLALWDLDTPVLYTVAVTLTTPHGTDELATRFGIRAARFDTDGFHLNGRLLKLRGLNRHQAYPYVGYAMGRAAQARDAEILKHELKLNIVRTSHYPQSPYFLDRCDELGLLVFEEIPGWQHVGDTAWQARSVATVAAMIRRDWNHPSIILWGVRVNESRDFHDFYAETNRVARALDTTRQTGGVRYIPLSEFLEDVFTQNDFALGMEEMPGANRPRRPLREQREITGLPHDVPYLVTEFGGHMYPTKRGDQEQRQAEHVRRHLEVLDAAYGAPGTAGAIGWCMADYNTHKDFGSGDRVCHHGVTDMFRAPKFAASVYASQAEPADGVVLTPVTYWTRGERNIGGILPLIVLTNCDAVELRCGDTVKRIGPDRETFPHLPHAPVVFDQRHFSADELGAWGALWPDGAIIGYLDGREVARVDFVANPVATRLVVAADRDTLASAERDAVRCVVRAVDQVGNILPFLDESIDIAVAGVARLIGPARVPLKGGGSGFWLESTGAAGAVRVTVSCPRLAPVTLDLSAR